MKVTTGLPASDAVDALWDSGVSRSGDDLRLVTSGGSALSFADFFSSPMQPLGTSGGSTVAGKMVAQLAMTRPGTSVGAALFGAPSAVTGIVRDVSGTATVIHADGTVAQLRPGDQLRADDVIATGRGGHLTFALTDGSTADAGSGSGGAVVMMGPSARLAFGGGDPSTMGATHAGGIPVTLMAGSITIASDSVEGPTKVAAVHTGLPVIWTPFGAVTSGGAPFAVHVDDSNGLHVVALADASDASAVEISAGGSMLALKVALAHAAVAASGAEAQAVGSLTCDDIGALFGNEAAALTSTCLAPQTASEMTVSGLNVSPGGDIGDLSSLPLTVTNPPSTFDLKPDAAPVSTPLDPLAQAAAQPLTPQVHDTESLYYGARSPQDPSLPLPQPVILTLWDPDRKWEVEGHSLEIADKTREDPQQSGTGNEITARAGYMAILNLQGETSSGADGVTSAPLPVAQIAQFLNVDLATLQSVFSDIQPSTGSAMKSQQTIHLAAGQTILFDVFFDANGVVSATKTGDFAVMSVGLGSQSIIVPILSAKEAYAGSDVGASGWQTLQYTAAVSGNYAFGFAVIDDRTPTTDTRLLVDNVRYAGSETFALQTLATYTDNLGGVATRSLPIPIANADAFTVNAGATIDISRVLNNDVDPDPFIPMSITGIDTTGTKGKLHFDSVSNVLTYTAKGTDFTALAEGEQTTDTVHYVLNSGEGATAIGTITITIKGVNDANIAINDVYQTQANARLDVAARGVLANDTDVDTKDVLRVSAVNGVATQVGQSITLPSGALLTLNADGSVHYNPNGQFASLGAGETAVDTITYQVSDRAVGVAGAFTSTATISITITGVNDAPIAGNDTISVSEDGQVTVNAIVNDHDVDAHDVLKVSAVSTTGTLGTVGFDAASGSVVYDARGHFDSLALGQTATDHFGYTVSDGHGGTATATVNVTITGVNDAPTAAPDSTTFIDKGAPVAIDVLANDDDVDSDDERSTLNLVAATSASGATVTITSSPTKAIVYDGSGVTAIKQLAEGEIGSDIVTYTITDRHGATATGTVAITVTGANDPVTAHDDANQTWANETLKGSGASSVLANDADVDTKDILRVSAVNGSAANVGQQIVLASGALLVLRADGTYSYDPINGFPTLGAGKTATEVITYEVSDRAQGVAGAMVSEGVLRITVTGVNDPPTAYDDAVHVDANTAVRLDVLDNDTDPDVDDKLSVIGIIRDGDGFTTVGEVQVRADGSVTYDPQGRFDNLAPGETATDTFQYVIDDGYNGRSVATVTVTIHGTDAPREVDQELLQSFEVPELGLVAGWLRLPGNNVVPNTSSPVKVLTAAQFPTIATGFTPTHLDHAVVLQASGSSGVAGFAGYSPIETFFQIPSLGASGPATPLPRSTLYHPTTGSAIRSQFVVDQGDLVSSGSGTGTLTLSFDWNFISAENVSSPAFKNDFAVFSISSGEADHVGGFSRMIVLSDASQVGSGASGWHTSTYTITGDFTIPATGELKLTIGFAVINDFDPRLPSYLLIDNVRLNRDLGADYDVVSTTANGHFVTYVQSPTAVPDVIDLGAVTGTTASISFSQLLANDGPSEGVTRSSLAVTGVTSAASTGTVSVQSDHLVYTPRNYAALAEGEVFTDHLTYTITDGNRGHDSADLAVRMTGLNDAPVAALDHFTVSEDATAAVLDVLANDTDVDSDDDASTLRIVAASSLSADGAIVTFSGLPGAGLVYNLRGLANFLPVGTIANDIDTVSYTVEDSHGARSTATVVISIMGVNDPPTAVDDAISVTAGSSTIFDAVANDTDLDSNASLKVSAIRGQAISLGNPVALASGALILLQADGRLIYDATNAFGGLRAGQTATDTFEYTVSDGLGGTDTGAVVVTVAGHEDPPVARPDFLSSVANAVQSFLVSQLLANDSDPDTGSSITLTGVSATSQTQGSVSFNGSQVVYNPTGVDAYKHLGVGVTATDQFTYTIRDETGLTATGTATVTVVGVNDAPVAQKDATHVAENQTVTVDPLANDSDPDSGDTVHVSSIDLTGTKGLVTLNADGTFTYDPNGKFDSLSGGQTAVDTFHYTVSDGHGGTSTAAVEITVEGRNNLETVVQSFETSISTINGSNPQATSSEAKGAIASYQEGDGAHGYYTPTDGAGMADLHARGTNFNALTDFLGIPRGTLPTDPVDHTIAAGGSAIKLTFTVAAGDVVSFDWVFDARDFVTNPPDGKADNDYAIFTVTGAGTGSDGYDLFKLSDVRTVGDQGASSPSGEWRSSTYTAQAAGQIVIGFGVVNDRTIDYDVKNPSASQTSHLLVDNVRINHDYGSGYQVVDTQANGQFETLVHTQHA